MATLKEWQHSVNALSPYEAERMADALTTLGTWKIFEKEILSECGVGMIYYMLKERAKVCEPHRYAWTGTIPCTGIQRCTICGHRKE